MTQAADIRAWLATQAEPQTAAAIAAAVNLKPAAVSMALGYMKTAGMVTGDGKRPQLYALVAGPKRVHARPEAERIVLRRQWCRTYKAKRKRTETPAQRAKRLAVEREQREVRRVRQGKRSRAEFRAEQAANRKPKPEPMKKPQLIEQAIATVRRMKAAKVQPQVRVKHEPAPAVRQAMPAQTVEEWLAQGGQIERLHPGACRDPLRVIGVAL